MRAMPRGGHRDRRLPRSPSASGAIGLLPVAATFAVAVPMHLGFTLLSPYRLVTFTSASLGMLALATVNPVLDPGFGG